MNKFKTLWIRYRERSKRVWGITVRNYRRWRDDIRWEIGKAEFYASRIDVDRLDPIETPWATPPLDPRAYPFDQKKADAAYAEVGRWINEDEMKKAENND